MCTDKKTLRGRYLAERASLSAEEKQAIDRGIAQNILQSGFYQQADCIFCYVSTAEEIDTRTVLENALASGKTVCVPLCGKGGSMTARKITALSELQTGHYGILEPSDTAPEIAPENIDLILAPALSCDRKGYRLGYGGGYYDRYLEQHAGHMTIALAYEFQILGEIPVGPYDKNVDLIVTEKRVIRCKDRDAGTRIREEQPC